ncbi:MAG: fibronectin type III domain-containing protein [Bacillota bacterium]|nr:fibronectin type III domain-containing protein [Bacillota bacterium]
MMRRKKSRRIFSLLMIAMLLSVGIICPQKAEADTTYDTYVPLTIASGYNADVIVEDETPERINGRWVVPTAVPFDGDNEWANMALCSATVASRLNAPAGHPGLPDDGRIEFTYGGGQPYVYQLGDYRKANAVQVVSNDNTQYELVFSTPGAYKKLSFFGASGNGTMLFTAEVTYTEGDPTGNLSFESKEWNDSGIANPDGINTCRIKIATCGNESEDLVGRLDSTYTPSLYHFEIEGLDPTRLVKSVKFKWERDTLTRGSAARTNILAVSGVIAKEAPSTPTGTGSTDATTDQFKISWNSVDGVGEYRVDVSTRPDFSNLVVNNAKTTETSYDVKGLSAGTKYYYRVRAVNNSGQSIPSAVGEETTEALPQMPTPNASVDSAAGKITGLTPNGSYTINGVAYTADANGKINISNEWYGTTISIIAKGDGSTRSDSLAQSLQIPAKDGAAKTPETGDDLNLGGIAVIMLLSALSLYVLTRKNKKLS